MQYQAVFFDLDGTLMDTSEGVLKAIDYIIDTFHLLPLSRDVKRSFIGPPIQQSFQMHYGCTPERASELAAAWRDAYRLYFLLDAVPYNGIYDLLRFLRRKGIKSGVATNKREDYTLQLLEHFSFKPLFDCIVGSDFAGKRSKTDMIRLCMEYTGVTDADKCLMIGDTTSDMTAAREAGIAFLGVSYGFGYTKNSCTPEILLANSCEEIQTMVCQ